MSITSLRLARRLTAAVVVAAFMGPLTTAVVRDLSGVSTEAMECTHSAEASVSPPGHAGCGQLMACCSAATTALASGVPSDAIGTPQYLEVIHPPQQYRSGGILPPPAPPPKA